MEYITIWNKQLHMCISKLDNNIMHIYNITNLNKYK